MSVKGVDLETKDTVGGRVLVVDDQPDNRNILARRLERRGYDVVVRDGALDIEKVVVDERIDLVLLDWMMPERSGLDALIGLRTIFDAERLPVIMVTALDGGDAVERALEGGANDYISKPIDMRVLIARVRSHLDRRAAVLALDHAKNDLEKTVQERTRELVEANESLSAEIAERQAAESRALDSAQHDSLTGLPNRRHFLEELEIRLSTQHGAAAPFALLYVDLNRFKPINDVHGHAVGDHTLQIVAGRLRMFVGAEGFCARLGGDEFALIMMNAIDDVSLRGCMERLSNLLNEPLAINGLRLTVGASLGAAIFPHDGQSASELLQRSDAAMLRAKTEGAEFRRFDASMDEALKRKAALEAELRVAIPNGGIIPFFQPVVWLKDETLASFEVLARWPHETRGMIPPCEFIPAAEEAGLIDKMFWAMLSQSCAAALKAKGDFGIAVNISPSQIRDDWLPQKVMRTLREHNFPPHRLEIEVTETAMISDSARAKNVLVSLKNQGIRVALDDFGTGYSSLALLRSLPIDKVKIDRSFVTNMLVEKENATIVNAIVGLGRSLGLVVTAEGIEDFDTARALRDIGCEYGQGYVFGKASAQPLYLPEGLQAKTA
ncbi:MAG: EAL domain-containing protein [Caulobacterales bacterium]